MGYIFICPKCESTYECPDMVGKKCSNCGVDTICSGYSNEKWYALELSERTKIKEELSIKEGFLQRISLAPQAQQEKPKEFRNRCRVCGAIFCYTEDDLKQNEYYSKQAKVNAVGGLFNALGGSPVVANQSLYASDTYSSKIINFSRCPRCYSYDIEKIDDEELEAMRERAGEKATPPISSADEIKKFKELLDTGIITQEEFEAKKKQLLGL